MFRRRVVSLLVLVSLVGAFAQVGCARRSAETAVARVAAKPAPAAAAHKKISFNEDVQPILANNCYACHGTDPGSRKADLRLDRAEHAYRQRKDGGPAIVPGQPDKSPLIQRIESTDEKKRMPPAEAHKTLKPEQIALLRQWVAEGAVYAEHWAFVAPKRPAVPLVTGEKPLTPIDSFVRARLAKEGLTLSPEADRRTLIRRVTIDLTGIVPTPEEVEAFLADQSPNAYERVVDRLLASPRYGEHRARYWLDYARYADTHGIHIDNYRAIWPYRDYVIRAFNSNKPFDAFVREQLAGDLLPAKTLDELAATGFVRCNLTTNEGGTIPEETYVNQTRDRVEAFGATFLGLTTGCAACHDHKFDPISQRDHYQLAAFLNNTLEKPWDSNIAEPPPTLKLPKEENRATAELVLAKRAELEAKLDTRHAKDRELVGKWLAAGNRPKPVDPTALELRLKLDEGRGDVVKNSAPGAKITEAKADTNPLIWGENSWFWRSMRMDIMSRLKLGNLGDVEANEKFSGGGWIMLRAKPGGGIKSGTGNGALLARMGDDKRHGGAGWDLYHENLQLVVDILPDASEPPMAKPAGDSTIGTTIDAVKKVAAAIPAAPATTAPAKQSTKKARAAAAAGGSNPRAMAVAPAKRGIQVATKLGPLIRDDWMHVFFTYDGSRKASGVKIYVNGKQVETEVRLDALAPKDSIRTDAAMCLGSRDGSQPMKETRFQDMRFYRRALAADEVARLPFEDVAAEIVAREPNPAKWTTDEAFVVADRFFLGEKDADTMALASAIAAHDVAFDALTKDGTPTLIALERPSPAYANLLKRGDYYARLDRVEPNVPHFLPPLPPGAPHNRRGLAEWLLMPEQPLMTRVTVNRMWEELFGRGIVETAGDFGIMGDRPSHPELLDWLAVDFREGGWDVKRFYKQLVMSATYRQSSKATPDRLAKDPDNKLLSRGPRFRMDAEELRDSALAVSGLLVEKLGGPSVKPYQPPGIWEEVAMPESNTRTYVQDKGDGLYRRSLYTFWKRSSPPVTLETFDAPSRETVCTRRSRANTPLQAFVTMNDPQWVEAARKLAERALKSSPEMDARLNFLARTTLARPLEAKESAVLRKSAEKFKTRFDAKPDDVKELLAVGDSKPDETLAPAEIAEWALVASEFLNLDEFLTK